MEFRLILFLFILSFLPFINAEILEGTLLGINSNNLDKIYSPEDRKIDIMTKDYKLIGSLQLLTQQKHFVSSGKNKTIATLKVNNLLKGYEFNEFVKEMELYDLKNGGTFNREVYYKLVTYSYESELRTKCNYSFETSTNGTNYSICNKIYYLENVTLKHQNDFNKYTPVGEFEMNIVMDVLPNEHGEWIFTAYDKRLEEFAEWSSDLNNSLVAYYKLDENASNTNVADSYSSNTGTASTNTVNLYTASGKINSAFDLVAASSEDVELPNTILEGLGALSISVWCKTDLLGAYRAVVYQQASVAGNTGIRMTNGNKFQAVITAADASETYVTGSTTISAGTWYHVVLIYDGSDVYLYVNGSSDATPVAQTGNTKDLDDAPAIGSHSGADFWDGIVDEVGIWNRSLNSSEITQLYNGGDGLPFGPPSVDSCTCPSINTNWEIDLTDYCIITSTCNLGTGNITFINTGNATFNATINAKNMNHPPTDGILFISSNAEVILG